VKLYKDSKYIYTDIDVQEGLFYGVSTIIFLLELTVGGAIFGFV